ncbi:MAG TPA: hypothetical protein DD435_06300 [Cyanobacteria bacterium UBA8530]|nr:hypothetical protein [Cyanobacteria bacterium UBA8530]
MRTNLLAVTLVCLTFSLGCKADQSPASSPTPTQPAATASPAPTSKSGSTLANLTDGRTLNFDLATGNWGSGDSFGQIYFINPNNHYMLNAVKDATFLDAGTTAPSEAPETGYSASPGGMEVFPGRTYLVKIPGNPTIYSRISVSMAQSNLVKFDFNTRLDGKKNF